MGKTGTCDEKLLQKLAVIAEHRLYQNNNDLFDKIL